MKKLFVMTGVVFGLLTSQAGAQEPSFDGYYVGMSAGAVWGTLHHDTDPGCRPTAFATFCDSTSASNANGPAVASAGSGSFSGPGFTGGLQGGHNWQKADFIYGGEVDLSVSALHESKTTTGAFPVTFLGDTFTLRQKMSTDWMASMRGRVGYAAMPRLMLYATGGLAFTNLKVTSQYSDNAIGFGFPGGTGYGKESSIRPGWTVGVGGEWLLGGAWSARAEYLYTDFGEVGFDVPTSNTDAFAQTMRVNADLRTHTMRLGLNYHF